MAQFSSHHLVQKSSLGPHSEVALIAQSNSNITQGCGDAEVACCSMAHQRSNVEYRTSNIGSCLSLDASKAAARFKLAHDLLGRNLELRWNCEVLFWVPVDRLRIGSLGASSFGTKQWWKDFTNYWFEGVRNFDSFIGRSFRTFILRFCFLFFLLFPFFSLFSRLRSRGYVGIYR